MSRKRRCAKDPVDGKLAGAGRCGLRLLRTIGRAHGKYSDCDDAGENQSANGLLAGHAGSLRDCKIVLNTRVATSHAAALAAAQADLKIGHYMLTGGPAEIAAAQEMQVQLGNRMDGAAALDA